MSEHGSVIRAATGDAAAVGENEFEQARATKWYPLTHPQYRIWHVEQSHPGTSMWNNAGTLKIRGKLDFDLLDRAVQLFVEANESLRLRIRLHDGEPVQYVTPYRPVHIDRLDFSDVGVKGLYEWDIRQTQAPMSLIDSPLYYFALAKTAPDEGYLYVKMHHIISDGVSFIVLANEIMEDYDRLLCGEEPIRRSPVSYLEYVEEERRYMESKRCAYNEAYWLKRFSDFPEATLLKPRTTDYFSTKAKRKAYVLSADLSAAVRRFCSEQRVSVFTLLLATFSVYLNRVLGKDDLVVSAPVSNRTFAGSSERFGMYVSTVPIRVTVDNEQTFLEFAEGISNEWFSVLKHQRYPYDLLMRKLHEKRDDITQLFDISLSYQVGTFELSKRFFTYEGRWHFSGHQASSLNIHWNDRENNGKFVLDYDYLTPLFAAKEVDFIHEHLCNLVADAISHPEKRLHELDMLSSDERDKVLFAFNDTDDGFPRTDLVSLWNRRVSDDPHSAALVYRKRTWTVAQLDAAANEIAAKLMDVGTTPGDVVALALPRSDVYFAAMLGILKAQAAFMPIDKALPEERVRFMLAESGARFAITGKGEFGGLELDNLLDDVSVINMDPEQVIDWASARGSDALGSRIRTATASAGMELKLPDLGQLAYIIYTSGSTGKPKGVAIEHSSIAHFVLSMRKVWSRTTGGRMLCVGPISFDINVMEAAIGLFSARTLVVADDRQADFPQELSDLIVSEGVDLMMVTPGRMEMILSTQAGAHTLRGLREIGLGADVLLPELLQRIRQATSAKITNFYGPTEATIAATSCDVTDCVDVNIGRPMNGVRVYILDAHMNPVPISVPGELYIGGAGVGRGYVAGDGLIFDRFVVSPFIEGDRLYRTGDLARWYPRGEIQFLGRIDQQVKIRGYRVELGEIQNRLLQINGVRSAAVIAHEEPDGRKCLCGYVVGDDVPPAYELKAQLSETLPFYMVPTYFMTLDELPLTASEKLDVRRLPKPQREQAVVSAPETATEQTLARLWEKILNVSAVGRSDHFFEIGGDSLSIVRMIAEVADVFDVDIDLSDVYRDPTLVACAALIDRAEAGYRKLIRPVVARKYHPASATQKRMLVAASGDLGSVVYNVPSLFVFEGSLDEDRLREALHALIKRHEVLRTALLVNDGNVVQQIHKVTSLPFESVTCPDNRITACAKEQVRPFDVHEAPLMRLVSIRTPKRHALLFDFHHAICDQAGFEIVIEDFSSLYRGDTLPPLTVDYKDYATWEEGRLASGAMDGQATYWRDQLAGGVPLLALPTDHPRTGKRKGAVCELSIPHARLETLNSFIRDEKATVTTALMTAFGLVLSRMALQDEIVIGIPVSGRTQTVLQHMAGAFINTLPVRCHFADGQSIRSCFGEVNRSLGEAVSHQDYPFDRIVSDSVIKREWGRNPLFDVMLVFGKNDLELILDEQAVSPQFVSTGTSKLDMTLFVYETSTGLECRLEYDRGLYSSKRAHRLLDRFVHTVETLFACPDNPLSQSCVLPPEELDLVTRVFSNTDTSYCMKPLSEWIEELADTRREDEAVVAYDGRLSFAELDQQADRIACALAEAGAAPGVLVAVMMSRSTALLPTIFGIIKSGAAYLPVDPTYPTERIALMISDSGASLLITDAKVVDACGGFAVADAAEENLASILGGVRVVLVDNALTSCISLDAAALRAERRSRCVAACEDDLAYIIYTSGSTGTPKGSRITLKGVANLRDAMATCIGFDPSWTAVSVTTMSFDIFVADALLPLTYGCRTVLADDDELRQPRLLADLIQREGIDYLQTTPSRMQIMIRDTAFKEAAKRLGTVVLAGEKPPLPLVRACKRLMPNARIKNGYGPTEVTVYTSFQDMSSSDHVSIGYPIANTRVYLLDEGLMPVPLGTFAEAYISGVGVSPGYIGRDELTRTRFLPDPFRPGSMMYRSGDICCFDEKGEIFIAGRVDHQVKIRGLRIEPGEIESQLCRVEGVEEAIVVVIGEGERKQLIAYITGKAVPETAQLRKTLAAHLPSYMVPVYFIYLDALPMTANGKVDRALLPDPQTIDRSTSRSSEVLDSKDGASRNNTKKLMSAGERRFLRTIERVLGTSDISFSDNIFDRGGDSLAVISIQAQLARFGWTLRTQDFYDTDTLEELFALVRFADDKALSSADLKREQSRKRNRVSQKNTIDEHSALLDDTRLRRCNAVAAAPSQVSAASIERILVTGATGYLGAHVVSALSGAGAHQVYCLVRGNDDVDARNRLTDALAVYGIESSDSIIAVHGDVSDTLEELTSRLTAVDTIIHCAAITEHVGKRTDYQRVNVEGTRRMVELANMFAAQLIHISTMSVAGIGGGAQFDEHSFDVGQDVSFNEYTRSKYLAESVVLEAFDQGLSGRILRVGNLTGRAADGVFQRDVRRNAFAMRLAAFARLGCYPADRIGWFEMTPVDACARAILLLSTNESARICHLQNDQRLDADALAELMRSYGCPIEPISTEEFSRQAISRTDSEFANLFGIVRDIVEKSDASATETSVVATSTALSILGFSWPLVDREYFVRYFAQIEAAVDAFEPTRNRG